MTKKKLAERSPSSDGEDDKYVARFMTRCARMAHRAGRPLDGWFGKLPSRLQNNLYYSGLSAYVAQLDG